MLCHDLEGQDEDGGWEGGSRGRGDIGLTCIIV